MLKESQLLIFICFFSNNYSNSIIHLQIRSANAVKTAQPPYFFAHSSHRNKISKKFNIYQQHPNQFNFYRDQFFITNHKNLQLSLSIYPSNDPIFVSTKTDPFFIKINNLIFSIFLESSKILVETFKQSRNTILRIYHHIWQVSSTPYPSL